MSQSAPIIIVFLALAAALFFAAVWLQLRNLCRKQQEELEELRQCRLDLERQLAETRALLQNEQQRNLELRSDSEANRKQLQMEFERLANKIFEEKQDRFSKLSKETLDSTLRPMREQMETFRKRVDEVHSADLIDRNRLKGQIEELHKQASQIGQDAVNLARALKGESKTQGDWGEMVLERLLEDTGLVKGSEYLVQPSHIAENGQRLRPDIVLRLPEGRGLIIDSKVSLKHYQEYVNTDDPVQREKFLALHVTSLRNHFRDLSLKKYQDLESIGSIDFVFMFIPIEPAYLLALREDPRLFDDAFGKNVTMVSHTTLMPMLKTVESLWRNERQSRNAREIASRAGKLYDKFVGVLESMDQIGLQIGKVQDAYDETRKRLGEGRGNLVSQTEKLRELGAAPSKQLPESVKHLLEGDQEEADG